MNNIGLINHTHPHTHAGTQDVNLTAGIVVRIIDKEKREGETKVRPGMVT